MIRIMDFPSAVRREPRLHRRVAPRGELGALARPWFEHMRGCGDDVRELLHDGMPTACAGDAAFGYVNAFTAHVNVGFFAAPPDLPDPHGLLQGTGKFMRHVKLRPGQDVNGDALRALIDAACALIRGARAGR